MTTDYNSMLMGGGSRGAKFEHEGAFVTGFIKDIDQRQRTDMKDGHLLTWPDGNPQMQLLIVLETELQEDEEDDGQRTVYVPIPSNIQNAIKSAVQKMGERGIGIGGKLRVKYVSTEAPKQRGFNGAKVYEAQYKPPVVSLDAPSRGADGDIEPDDLPF
jgi:hypothetical protein